MPSLILTDTGPGYPLVQGSQSIVALGNAGGGGGPTNGLILEDGSGFILTENGDYLVQE